MAGLKLSPPWVVFYRKVNAMFENDLDVQVLYDEDAQVLKLFVNNVSKADALSQILPTQKEFGNVTMEIVVIPPNNLLQSSDENLFGRAFICNNAVSFIDKTVDIPGFPSITYVVFRKEVVQFFTDNLCDYNGITSTLYQDIAKDIFINTDGVYFCTDKMDMIRVHRCETPVNAPWSGSQF